MRDYEKAKFIIIFFLCCLALLPAGCSRPAGPEAELPAPGFEEGEPHSNALAFRLWFETMTSTAGPCTVSIQDKIYGEEQAEEWWYAIQGDLRTLNQALGITGEAYAPFTVYVVEKTLHGIQVWNNCLYCTPEDILSGAYREGLIGAALTREPWKQAGLSRVAFGAEQADREQIVTYLENAGDLGILSLFAACFVDEFAAEEEISIAQGLSQLLCEHVIAEHGGAVLVEDACIDCRQELLDELGVNRTYTDRYGDFDSGYQYGSSEDYPLIVTATRGDTFYITPLPGNMETPAAVYELLYDAWRGPQAVLELVKTEAPEYADIMAQNYRGTITCYLNPDRAAAGNGSYTNILNREIQLGHRWSIVHEIMHIIAPLEHSVAERWKCEAVAEYLTQRAHDVFDRERYYDAYFPNGKELPPEDYEDEADYLFDRTTLDLYLAEAGRPKDASEFDVAILCKAWLKAAYLTEYSMQSISEVYQSLAKDGGVKARGGNELSYTEAAVFSDYLVRTYSLSVYLDYCLNADAAFEDTFGVDYGTAKAAWLEDLLGAG